MKAVVKTSKAPGAELVDMDVPVLGPKDVLIKVRATGICGGDIHIVHSNSRAMSILNPPVILGHETCGDVVETGAGVSNIRKGDLVSVEPHIPCGACYQCQTGSQHICINVAVFGIQTDGAFAEFAKVPEICCWKLPKGTSADLGAILEPLGVAVHSVLVEEVNGKSVAVFGCGPIGLFAIGAASALGATKTFALEVVPNRLAMAPQFAPDAILIDPNEQEPVSAVREATDGEGVDVAIDLTGNAGAFTQALKVLRRGGRITLASAPPKPVELDIYHDVWHKEARLIGIWGRTMWQTWWQVRNLLSTGKFDPLSAITHRFQMADYADAIELAAGGEAGKVLLYP